MQKKWKSKDIFELRRLWLNGATSSELAEKFGVSRNSIIGKLNRLNLLNRGQRGKKSKKKVASANKVVIGKINFLSITDRLKELKKPKEGVPIINIKNNQCRFILSYVDGINTPMCGKEIKIGAFCEEHARMCYANFDELAYKGWKRIYV